MSYKFETVSCNLCKSDAYHTVSKIGKFGLPTNVVICKNCGLSYLNPRWDKESYMQFYQDDYDQYYRPQIRKATTLKTAQSNPIEIRLKRLGLLPEKVERILDIGSGEGINLIHFQSIFQESESHAIEPSISSQTHLKKQGVQIIGSDVDTNWDEAFEGHFDIILMRHVLEHFLDPIKIMKKVRKVLKPAGIAYIAVPNNLKPTQNLEQSWFRNVHTYYFNKYSLRNLCSLVGLEILEMREGDEFNKGEVYLIVKKGTPNLNPTFSEQHYLEQLAIFERKLKQDRNLFYKTSSLLRRKLSKLLFFINKK